MSDNPCRICGMTPTEKHHCIFGTANRKLCDEDGLIAWLCNRHHTGADGVHARNLEWKKRLQEEAQASYERTHTREEWMQRYGRNYL